MAEQSSDRRAGAEERPDRMGAAGGDPDPVVPGGPVDDAAEAATEAEPPAGSPDSPGAGSADGQPDAAATEDEATGDGPNGDEVTGDGATGNGGHASDGPVADARVVDVEDLQAEDVDIEALLDERAQFLEAYRRAQADFENFRKVAARRQTEAVDRAVGSFVERLLPVLDACDAARAHGSEDVAAVASTLLAFLEKEGLERVEPTGEPFDPNVADAVVHEPGEGGDPLVSEVLRVGYLFNGRVIRPAMVKVSD